MVQKFALKVPDLGRTRFGLPVLVEQDIANGAAFRLNDTGSCGRSGPADHINAKWLTW